MTVGAGAMTGQGLLLFLRPGGGSFLCLKRNKSGTEGAGSVVERRITLWVYSQKKTIRDVNPARKSIRIRNAVCLRFTVRIIPRQIWKINNKPIWIFDK